MPVFDVKHVTIGAVHLFTLIKEHIDVLRQCRLSGDDICPAESEQYMHIMVKIS